MSTTTPDYRVELLQAYSEELKTIEGYMAAFSSRMPKVVHSILLDREAFLVGRIIDLQRELRS